MTSHLQRDGGRLDADEPPRAASEQRPAKEPIAMKVKRLVAENLGMFVEPQLRIVAPAEVDDVRAILAERADCLADFILIKDNPQIERGRVSTDKS